MPRIIAQNRLSRVTIGNRPITYNPTPPLASALISGTVYDQPSASGFVTLTNGGLNVALNTVGGGTWRAARSLSGRTAGRYHWEVRMLALAGSLTWNFGLVRTAAFNNLQFCGQNADSIGCSHGGAIFVNNAGVSPSDTLAVGDTMEVEVDLNAKLYWCRRVGRPDWNQTVGANPATGVGGASFAAMVGPFAPGASLLELGCATGANFGSTALIGTVSAGYTRGWPL